MKTLRSYSSLAALAATLSLTLPTPVEAQAPPACDTAENKQFDFWIGEWEARIPDGSVAGHNTIRKILNGCVLHESYTSVGGYAGESFNIYDASRDVWHQTWVDLGGLLLLLEGRFKDGVMFLEGETTQGEQTVRQRIQWSLVDGNADRVRQLWQSSIDGGETWTVAFDGLYVRKSGGPSPQR